MIAAGERVVCILTGHQLKDPKATVAYHSADQKTFEEVLGKRGVRRASFANRAVQVPNDLDEDHQGDRSVLVARRRRRWIFDRPVLVRRC